jgi:hypothetical protein
MRHWLGVFLFGLLLVTISALLLYNGMSDRSASDQSVRLLVGATGLSLGWFVLWNAFRSWREWRRRYRGAE